MPTLIVADQAWDEAADIAHRIGQDNLKVALKVYKAIEDAFELLAKNPGLGASCELANVRFKDYRFWPLKKYRDYLVIYRPLADGVEITRVIHGAMDMGRVLK
jgi:plasmid stabilization system protein ParE